MPSARAITVMATKYCQDMDESPAMKQRMSSGKRGRTNIAVRMKLSFPFIFFSHLSRSSFPTIQATALYPTFLPIRKAVIDPRMTPTRLHKNAFVGPNSATPAAVLTNPGMGRITTCRYCRTIYRKGIQIPARSRYSAYSSGSRKISRNPVFCNTNSSTRKNRTRTKPLIKILKAVCFPRAAKTIATAQQTAVKAQAAAMSAPVCRAINPVLKYFRHNTSKTTQAAARAMTASMPKIVLFLPKAVSGFFFCSPIPFSLSPFEGVLFRILYYSACMTEI